MGKVILIMVMVGINIGLQAQSLKEIITTPKEFNGKIVEVEGEVIGDIIKTEKGIWFNLGDKGYNLGVYSDSMDKLKEIKWLGAYKVRGDTVRARGIFYTLCPQHKEMDLHLEKLTILKEGMPLEEIVPLNKIRFALTLSIICLTLAVLWIIKLKICKSP